MIPLYVVIVVVFLGFFLAGYLVVVGVVQVLVVVIVILGVHDASSASYPNHPLSDHPRLGTEFVLRKMKACNLTTSTTTQVMICGVPAN